ncbi:MAG: hypothetical protein CFE24_04850 [Flavobacterium sp. BFFFF2]|nr:MAG: hypothetical protein CFE24_04850 [Flavobacterium sp. BFFFF2]
MKISSVIDNIKPNLNDIVYTNSCGRIYQFGFELLINNDYLFFSWNVVDTVYFEKKNKVNIYKLGLLLIITLVAIAFNVYIFPQIDWVINGGFIIALLIALVDIAQQVPLIIIKFKDGTCKVNQIPHYHIDVAKDFTRMIKNTKDRNYAFNDFAKKMPSIKIN